MIERRDEMETIVVCTNGELLTRMGLDGENPYGILKDFDYALYRVFGNRVDTNYCEDFRRWTGHYACRFAQVEQPIVIGREMEIRLKRLAPAAWALIAMCAHWAVEAAREEKAPGLVSGVRAGGYARLRERKERENGLSD